MAPDLWRKKVASSSNSGSNTADTAVQLLVKSGAFFDFAGEWCSRHQSLVELSKDNREDGAKALEALLRETSSAKGLGEQRLYREFRSFVVTHDEVWKRSEADLALRRAIDELDGSGDNTLTVVVDAKVAGARKALRTSLVKELDKSAPAAEKKAADAIRARFLTEGIVGWA